MNVTSTEFAEGAEIPALYTCDGRDINPPLRLGEVPSTTQTLALIMDDPDAPVGTWTHWTMWNIDPTITEIPEHYAPSLGVEGVTSRGTPGYHGPCPPSGSHRYFFHVYALETTLDISTDTDAGGVRAAMDGHIIAEATLVGRYARK